MYDAKTKIDYADGMSKGKLRSYLCSMGPAYCPKCESACAYGREWLKLSSKIKNGGGY